MSNLILSQATWDELAAEYVHGPDVESWSDWVQLLNVVYSQTDDVCPLPDCVDDVGLVFTNHLTDGRAVSWQARPDASKLVDSFEALLASYQAQQQDGLPIPVWNLRPNHPYFSNRDALAYQAWHDTGHIEHALTFSQDDELRLFGVTARRLNQPARDALFGEIVYPLAAATAFDGYLDQQYTKKLGPVGRAVQELLIAL